MYEENFPARAGSNHASRGKNRRLIGVAYPRLPRVNLSRDRGIMYFGVEWCISFGFLLSGNSFSFALRVDVFLALGGV